MSTMQRGKRRAWFLHHKESQVVDFVLKSNQVPVEKEIVQGLEQVSKETATKCLQCKKSSIIKLVTKYNQDIGCSGCVRQLRQTLESPGPCRTGLMGALFDEGEDETLVLRPRFKTNTEIGKVFSAFNSQAYFSARKGGSKRQRCPLHTANPRMDEPWIQVWDEMPEDVQENIARLDIREMRDQLTEHLKQLYFCRDCRGNVLKALDLLVGFVDPLKLEEGEEFAPEYFRSFLLGRATDTYWSLVDDASPRPNRALLGEDEQWANHEGGAAAHGRNGHGARGSGGGSSSGGSSSGSGSEDATDSDLGDLVDVDSTDYPVNLDEFKVKTISQHAHSHQSDHTQAAHKSGDMPDMEKPSPQEEIFSQSEAQREGKVDAASPVKRGALSKESASGAAAYHDEENSNSAEEEECDCSECLDRYDQDDEDDEDDFDPKEYDFDPKEYFDDLDEVQRDARSAFLTKGATHLLANLEDVVMLIQRAEEADARDELNRQSGGSSDRHAPTLKDGQMELLHCIGKVLLDRIRDTWVEQLVLAQTGELLTWLTLSCMRTNLQTAMQSKSEESLYLFLEEGRDKERKDKKKRKKKAGKKKKQTQQQPKEQQKEPEKEQKDHEEQLLKEQQEKLRKEQEQRQHAIARAAATLAAASPSKQPSAPAASSSASTSAAAKKAAAVAAAAAAVRGSSDDWDRACEARLLAQFGAGSGPKVAARSPFSAPRPLPEGFLDRVTEPAASDDEDASDGEGLTADEIREAQLQLQRMMGSSSRAELRANLREKFYNLSSSKAN